jgi:hypothetical protein
MVKSFGRQGNGHNDDEIEEQFERCRPTPLLCRISSAHRRGEVRVECTSQRSLAHCNLHVRDSARFSDHGLCRDFARLAIGEGFAALCWWQLEYEWRLRRRQHECRLVIVVCDVMVITYLTGSAQPDDYLAHCRFA